MTPAVAAAEKAGIRFTLHEYEHDVSAASYGEEAADKLGIDPDTVFKTLVVEEAGSRPAVVVVPVLSMLDLKSAARALGAKKLQMVDKAKVERVTGYVLGGVSPLGQRQSLATVIDASAFGHDTIHVSAGRRGLEIGLAPDDLATLCRARFAEVARPR